MTANDVTRRFTVDMTLTFTSTSEAGSPAAGWTVEEEADRLRAALDEDMRYRGNPVGLLLSEPDPISDVTFEITASGEDVEATPSEGATADDVGEYINRIVGAFLREGAQETGDEEDDLGRIIGERRMVNPEARPGDFAIGQRVRVPDGTPSSTSSVWGTSYFGADVEAEVIDNETPLFFEGEAIEVRARKNGRFLDQSVDPRYVTPLDGKGGEGSDRYQQGMRNPDAVSTDFAKGSLVRVAFRAPSSIGAEEGTTFFGKTLNARVLDVDHDCLLVQNVEEELGFLMIQTVDPRYVEEV